MGVRTGANAFGNPRVISRNVWLGQMTKRRMGVRGVAGRLGGIAICGALFAMRPPTYIQYAIRAARLKLHPHLTIPPIRPAGDTRSRIFKQPAAPALIGCTHQHQLKRRAALEAAKRDRSHP